MSLNESNCPNNGAAIKDVFSWIGIVDAQVDCKNQSEAPGNIGWTLKTDTIEQYGVWAQTPTWKVRSSLKHSLCERQGTYRKKRGRSRTAGHAVSCDFLAFKENVSWVTSVTVI